MRGLFAIVLLASPALADPTAQPSGSPVAAAGGSAAAASEREHPDLPRHRAGDPGFVIAPPEMTDAQPYPRGMVIAPPGTGDRMADPASRPWAWGAGSPWQRFEASVGALWNTLRLQSL
jgi:hypothetical protein